jgi:hypothetical protein
MGGAGHPEQRRSGDHPTGPVGHPPADAMVEAGRLRDLSVPRDIRARIAEAFVWLDRPAGLVW